jgi:hypothetical protein
MYVTIYSGGRRKPSSAEELFIGCFITEQKDVGDHDCCGSGDVDGGFGGSEEGGYGPADHERQRGGYLRGRRE